MKLAAQAVVNMLLENEIIRACAHCEKDYGAVPLQPGQVKSHGMCRRHAEESALAIPEAARGDLLESYKQAADSIFCPDLGSNANVAQLVEQLPSKQHVVGSTPIARSTSTPE